jgi:hypothetical protein
MAVAAVSTPVALSVHTTGRERPVASAKPAMAPVASTSGMALTATTLDVPIEITTSPGEMASPSAAAAAPAMQATATLADVQKR